MTREEAIEIIESIDKAYRAFSKEEYKALEIAIKVLKQKPCEDAISRAEAIRVASGYCHWSNIPDELAKLPSVNPIPCEDAISRQAAIDALNHLSKNYAGIGRREYHPHIDFVIDVITMLPPVSVAEKVEIGHWSRKTKVDAYDLCGVKTWGIKCQCDRCTFTTIVVEDFGYYKYCPNCGARMV